MKGCYLIHFDKEIPITVLRIFGDKRHYFGYSSNISRRFKQHESGVGRASVPCKKAVECRIGMTLARTFEGGPELETEILRDHKDISKLCPVCIGLG